MRNQRSFSPELKRQVVEEVLSEVSTAAQLCRRRPLSSSLLDPWKRQYAKGAYENEPTKEAALEERVRPWEPMLGNVILENECFKKAVRKRLAEAEQDARSCKRTGTSSPASKGGVTS